MEETISYISNEYLQVKSSTYGAELTSLFFNDTEYLWQADPRWWNKHASILFPYIGKLKGDHAETSRGPINFYQHGIARRLTHKIEKKDENSITYLLASDNNTKKIYPYDFELRTTYEIVGKSSIKNEFKITNKTNSQMPFSIGEHTAYNVPLNFDDSFEDYEIRFTRPWTYSAPTFNPEVLHFDRINKTKIIENSQVLKLDRSLFKYDAQILKDVPDRTIELVNKKDGHGVRIDFNDFKYLAIWSTKHNAPFLCLQPWTACATFIDEDDIFEHKQDMLFLEPEQSMTLSFTITLL